MGDVVRTHPPPLLSPHQPVLPWVSTDYGSLPTPHSVLTSSMFPAPSHSSSFPGGLLGASGRNSWPEVRGGALAGSGRQCTHARDRSKFQLPRACWEYAKRGRGGAWSPSSQKAGGQEEPGERPEGQKQRPVRVATVRALKAAKSLPPVPRWEG